MGEGNLLKDERLLPQQLWYVVGWLGHVEIIKISAKRNYLYVCDMIAFYIVIFYDDDIPFYLARRSVLSRCRWRSGEVIEERPAAHQWPRKLHRFPYATPWRTRYVRVLAHLYLFQLYESCVSTFMYETLFSLRNLLIICVAWLWWIK